MVVLQVLKNKLKYWTTKDGGISLHFEHLPFGV